jgi:hypothetical protein
MKIQIGDCGMNFGRFVLLCLIALVEFASPCYADYVCTTNGYDFSYTLKDGCATITETAGGLFDGRELVVPAKLDGHPVTSIGMNSFALITNSYYSTKCGHAFVENGPTEIGRQAFHTDGTGWNIVCIPGSVTTFSGASCFRSIGKLYWTVSSETQTIYTNAFSNPPRSIRIVAICGVPNELHDKCSLWTEFNHYGRGRESHSAVYYKCKKQYFDAWVERGGLGQFRGYVADDYVYGEDAVVSFDTGSGDPVADRVYRQGSPYESLPTPTKLGYKFSAWRTIPYPEAGADKGFVVDGDEVVASPKETLYAEWTPLKPTWTVNGENVVYDGAAHGITISPKAPVDGVVVTYSETEEGPYTDVSPTLTEAGTKEIWYVLKAPDWAPLTNSATLKVMKLVSDATVSKALSRTTFTYSGAANRPSVKVKDTTLSPDLTVTAYAAGDVDGDGVLSEDDVTLIKRYNAYQKLSDENKEKFSSYNLTGDALTAADVNQDGQVNADDVTALQDMFACYELVEGTDYTVTYSDNIKAGTGHVTITGKGNYGGTVTLDFEIQKATIGEDVGFDDGLYSGVILGDTSKTWGNGINLSDYPAVTNICSYPEMATACQNDDGDDPDNSVYNRRWRTWVYWGEMYLAAGTYRLAASFDDAVYMKLDGNVLANKKGWTTVDFSNFTISETGWYPVEFRFHNDQERAGDSIAHGNYGWVERKNLAIQNITSNPTSTDTTADNFAIPGFDINGNFVSGTFRLPGSSAVTEVDATAVYDGEGHTVNTNALVAAKIGSDSFTVSYSLDGANGWQVEPFVYTNAGQYVFWYRLQNENYNDYVHQVQLTITPKPISDSTVAKSLTAESFVYDGTAKAPTVTITDESVFRWQFVAAYAAGDVNGDGVLAQDDADAIDQYVAYLELDDDMKPLFEEYALTGDALTAADYNGDGVVDAADVTALEASFVTLKEGVDYMVAYGNNIEAGAAKVIVTGMGNYGGTATLDFEIEPLVSVKNLKVTQIAPMGLAIDFDVEGSVANYALEVKAITQGGAVTNVAKTLSGDIGCSNGAHRVYWNTAKDGISIERERAVIEVGYKAGNQSGKGK